MKMNQKGFSVVAGVVIAGVLVLVGAAGVMVYKNQNKDDAKKVAPSSANEEAAKKLGQTIAESSQTPQGFITFEDKNVGFKFSYPKEWRELQVKNEPKALLLAEAPDTDSTNSSDTLKVVATTTDSFSIPALYHGATVKPVKSGQGYTWQVVDPNTQSEMFKKGDTYTPAPKIAFQKGDLKVYEFPNGHANVMWTTFAFAVDDAFVAVVTPIIAPSIELTQAQHDAQVAAYQADLAKVAKSIRIL